MRKVMTIAAAAAIPLVVIFAVGNVKWLRDVFIPATPRFGGGE